MTTTEDIIERLVPSQTCTCSECAVAREAAARLRALEARLSPAAVPEKLRRTQQAFPSLTLPEAIQLLGQLHDAGLDVIVRESA